MKCVLCVAWCVGCCYEVCVYVLHGVSDVAIK